MSCVLSLQQVVYHYEQERFEFDCQLEQGQILALMGPSGSGKSTLLSLIAGFIEPISGDIQVQRKSVLGLAPHQRGIAMLFQEHNLFTHLSVRDNIGLGLHSGLKLTSSDKQQVEQAAQQVGLEDLLDRLPEQLSGGQKQRVALARCFVQSHSIWLLDEPFSALDPVLREDMLQLVKRLAYEREVSVVMVTHHISDAKNMATHFAFMQQGKICESGSMEMLFTQKITPQLAAFIQ
ncbi:thiamine ABC transporter ATP-binding protein [Vibrio sp. S17_S38]|uniref:thiamine ABC transporter ATP-binding protein n=1 Tax=Vibrio sp. S17_S38 TaxID=2720229 RepID=UPI0016816580|nr:thiamine ABC transporter ATP-binding protein [Vibrio sp. S17_S38]MBD1574436.1 thiamine ABC transporter ATP-binding protein [Vibrio sp. S17_S38]